MTYRAATLRAHAADARIDTVLDYGGDRRQRMLGGPGSQHFVFDVSGVEPESGVTALDAASLKGQAFDLVLLCEVLEHVSDPVTALADAARHVRPGGLLYVTVPNQEFPLTSIPDAAWYRAYLGAILKFRWLVMALDFWYTGFRIKFVQKPPLVFAKLHEYVTFFDHNSLALLLQSAGLAVLSCEASADGCGG